MTPRTDLSPISPFNGLPVEPISTAPRNGLSIFVGDQDCGEFIMHWDPVAENGLFPGALGFWVALDGSSTWSEHDGWGPTYWRHLAEPGLDPETGGEG